MARPEVTAIVPVYNGAGTIARALRSIADQTWPVSEVIVVDDASTDGLTDALGSFAADLRLIRQESNQGAAEARNAGLRVATGRYVAFLDADDVWEPRKLERQLDFMARRGLDITCAGAVRAGHDRRERSVTRPLPAVIGVRDLVWGCHIAPGSTMVADRAVLLRLSGYDQRLVRFEDWDLLLRAAKSGITVGYLREPLARLSGSVKPGHSIVMESLARMREKHQNDLAGRGDGLGRKFEAALRFETAVSAWSNGKPLRAAYELASCLCLAPRGNKPLRVIIGGHLSSALHRPSGGR